MAGAAAQFSAPAAENFSASADPRSNMRRPQPQHFDDAGLPPGGFVQSDLYDDGARAKELPRLSGSQQDEEYYMRPSSEELASLFAEQQGNNPAMVKDFTIGRKGYGSICWIGETDVRGLEVHRFVCIGRVDVRVYDPDMLDEHEQVPARGQRLNKPARITFELGEQNEKIGRKVDRDPLFLKRRSTKMDAKHLSYDKDKGTWQIECKHFSADQ
jgi:nuclear pore complex protein Nup98-Nup96